MIDLGVSPRVSVVIPTHNRVNLLSRAIQSVLNQTYKDFEIIIVDDASSDETGDMIENLSDPRIKYVRHVDNQGGAAARNTGIKHSRGSYIGFLDDDDEWLRTKLESQVEYLETERSVDVVYSGFLVRDLEKGKIIGKVLPEKKGDIFSDLLRDNCVGTTSTVLIRNDCLERSELFDEKMPSCQDWDMWLKLSKCCVFDYIDEPLVIYNIHRKRITTCSESGLLGKRIIFDKYKEQILSDGAISSRHYLRIGSSYCQLGDMKRGREAIRRSIKLNPTNALGYVTYLSSLLGCTMYTITINRYKALQYRAKRNFPFI